MVIDGILDVTTNKGANVGEKVGAIDGEVESICSMTTIEGTVRAPLRGITTGLLSIAFFASILSFWSTKSAHITNASVDPSTTTTSATDPFPTSFSQR